MLGVFLYHSLSFETGSLSPNLELCKSSQSPRVLASSHLCLRSAGVTDPCCPVWISDVNDEVLNSVSHGLCSKHSHPQVVALGPLAWSS